MKETRNTFQKTVVFEMLQEMHDHEDCKEDCQDQNVFFIP